jgi:hypothetical protein
MSFFVNSERDVAFHAGTPIHIRFDFVPWTVGAIVRGLIIITKNMLLPVNWIVLHI